MCYISFPTQDLRKMDLSKPYQDGLYKFFDDMWSMSLYPELTMRYSNKYTASSTDVSTVFEFEIPGFDKSEVNVYLENDYVHIDALKYKENSEKEKEIVKSFKDKIYVEPKKFPISKTAVELKNGILKVEIFRLTDDELEKRKTIITIS